MNAEPSKKPQSEAEWLDYLHVAMFDRERAVQQAEAIQSTLERQRDAMASQREVAKDAEAKIEEAKVALRALWR